MGFLQKMSSKLLKLSAILRTRACSPDLAGGVRLLQLRTQREDDVLLQANVAQMVAETRCMEIAGDVRERGGRVQIRRPGKFRQSHPADSYPILIGLHPSVCSWMFHDPIVGGRRLGRENRYSSVFRYPSVFGRFPGHFDTTSLWEKRDKLIFLDGPAARLSRCGA